MFELIIIYLQKNYGGNFFIPKKFRRMPYQRHLVSLQKLIRKGIFSENQCAICLSSFISDLYLIRYERKNKFSFIKNYFCNNDTYIFKTPCSHFFHYNCLLSWMEMKDDCPICRRKLNMKK